MPEQERARERLTDVSIAEHDEHATDERAQDGCGPADDHRDEELDRDLERRRRRRGRKSLDEHEAGAGRGHNRC